MGLAVGLSFGESDAGFAPRTSAPPMRPCWRCSVRIATRFGPGRLAHSHSCWDLRVRLHRVSIDATVSWTQRRQRRHDLPDDLRDLRRATTFTIDIYVHEFGQGAEHIVLLPEHGEPVGNAAAPDPGRG